MSGNKPWQRAVGQRLLKMMAWALTPGLLASVTTLGGYTEIASARPDERQVRIGVRVAF